MLFELCQNRLRGQHHKNLVQESHAPKRRVKRHVFNTAEEKCYPRVVRRLLKTPKGLTESQVANNVKSCVVEPGHYVKSFLVNMKCAESVK